jgi:hypothetical protein
VKEGKEGMEKRGNEERRERCKTGFSLSEERRGIKNDERPEDVMFQAFADDPTKPKASY